MGDRVRDSELPIKQKRGWFGSAVLFLLVYFIAIVFLSSLGWCIWVYVEIQHFAYDDQAGPADVICVFGAAEYDGKPSPVLRARLDHALALYEHGNRSDDPYPSAAANPATPIPKARSGRPT